ncbi:MAG: nicotinate-nucleotide adenylyltransferase [Pseudomonadota bacterium]
MNPIGILGGTFDPIHYGHLRLAQEAADGLGLDHVRFIPCHLPPHRDVPRATPAQRLEMVRLALRGNPAFVLDTREMNRGRPSYSVDTLTDLRAELGNEVPLCLIMGADAFLGLETWRQWRQLFDLAHIVVASRAGALDQAGLTPALRAEFAARRGERSALSHSPHGTITPFAMTALDISATRIRQDVARGESMRYLLPDAVLDYIQRHKLYQEPHESR